MPRFSDTSLQNSKPSVDRKNRKKNVKDIKRTNDPAALEMLDYTIENNIITAFDRWSAQQPQCAFGYQGICCRICFAGPCRIKGLEGPGSMGICGAKDYTIVARNAIRMMAGGASAHSDHGRELVEVLYHMSEGKAPDYEIRDADKLKCVAKKIGLEIEGKTDIELAKEVALAAFEDYGRHTSEGTTFLKANLCEKRIKKYEETDTMPRAIDREVVEVMHRTHVGVDADPVNLIFGGVKCSLADLTGEQISTDISDILFGTPKPVMSEANLGVVYKKMSRIFSIKGISVIGAITHNMAQLTVASLIVRETVMLYYFPVLLISAVVTGLITGSIGELTVQEIKKREIFLDII
jgi:carbon-monoxide dehydrogenase catalytic subunit